MTLSQTSRRALTAGFLLTAVFYTGAAAQANSPQGVRNIVIVHGAWADGSSWSKVIPRANALSPESSRRLNRASCSQSREPHKWEGDRDKLGPHSDLPGQFPYLEPPHNT